MKSLLFILLFYTLSFAQLGLNLRTETLLSKRYCDSQQTSTQNYIFTEIDLNGNSPLYNYAFFRKNQVKQSNHLKFNKQCLSNLSNASHSLKTSLYLKYGSNGVGILQDLYLLGTNIGSTSLYNMFTVSANFLDITSIISTGRISDDLQQLGTKINRKDAYLLRKASNEIIIYKNYNIASAILGFIGASTILYTIISADESIHEDEALTRGLGFSSSVAIGAIVTKFIALHHIEKAGKYIKETSELIQDNAQKQHLNKFGENLIKSSQNWKKGFWYKFLAVLTPIPSTVISNETQALRSIFIILAATEFITGEIYQNWIAPFNLFQAGENLEDLKDDIKNQ